MLVLIEGVTPDYHTVTSDQDLSPDNFEFAICVSNTIYFKEQEITWMSFTNLE